MMFLLYIMLIFLGICMPKSKPIRWITIFFMLFMFSFVEYEGDYQQYQLIYQYFDNSWLTHYEPGFTAIIWLCKTLNLPYCLFRLVVACIFVFGTCRAITKQTPCVTYVVALVFLFPFFVAVATIRSALACAIILNAIPYLQERTITSVSKYICLILLATLFHYSSLLCLLFLLVNVKLTRNRMVALFAASVVGGAILYQTDWINRILRLFTENQKILQWFYKNESTTNFTGAVATLVVLVVLLFMVRKAEHTLQKHGRQQMAEHANLMMRISVVLLCLFPLIAFSAVFMRIVYFLLPYFYISAVNTISCQRINQKATIYINSSVVLLSIFVVLICFYYDLPYLKAGNSMYDSLFQLVISWE